MERRMGGGRGWRAALVAGALALGLLAAACGETAVTLNQTQDSGISVSGRGTVTVVPDIAVLSIGVEATRSTVALARAEAAQAMEALQLALEENGVAEADIKTVSFSIRPQYSSKVREAPEIIGYIVGNQVSVKVRDLDSVSVVVDAATAAAGDAARVNSVSFTVDEPEQYYDEARAKAVADARERAEQLAELAGVTLGRARTVSESSGPVPVVRTFDAAMFRAGGAESAPTPLSPGEQEISLTVYIVYDIE